MTDGICPLAHRVDPDRPRRTTAGALLCAGHVHKVDDQLEALATFARDADAAERDAALSSSSAPPLSGSKEQPLIFSDALAEQRIKVRGVLASWALLVAEERGIAAPDAAEVLAPRIGPACRDCVHRSCRQIRRSWQPQEQDMVKLCAAFLRRHHLWSVGQSWADDYAGEILELGSRCWKLLHPSGRRRFEVGKCAEVGCTGNVWALLTPDDPYADVASELVCDMCEVRVTSDRWLVYGRKVRKDAAA